MKILHLVGTLNPGGIERLVTDLSIEQKKQGLTPGVCCLIEKTGAFVDALEKENIPIFEAPYGRWPWLLLQRLTDVLKKWQPDIIHSHVNFSLLWQIGAQQLAGKSRFMITQHTMLQLSPALMARSRPMYRLLRPAIARHIAVSDFAARHAAKLYGCSPESIFVIPNGIAAERFAFDACARSNLRQAWGIAEQEFLWGSVGRLGPVKGYDILIRAAQQALQQNDRLRFAIAGAGDQLQELKDLSRELHCEQAFLWLGRRSDISRVLSAFDAYVQPSRYETASLSSLEALANGLDIVASRVGGLQELAEKSPKIKLFDVEDSAGLSQALLTQPQTITTPPIQRVSACPETHTFSRMSNAYMQAYTEVFKQ